MLARDLRCPLPRDQQAGEGRADRGPAAEPCPPHARHPPSLTLQRLENACHLLLSSCHI